MGFDFRNCEVLVTGGTRGIGYGVAKQFAEAGASVTITGTRPSASDYEQPLDAFRYIRCRLSSEEDVASLADSIDTLDVLVNNAGQSRPEGASEWEPRTFQQVVDVDLVGPYRVTEACLPALKKSVQVGGASVINNLSLTVFFGEPLVPAVGAAKAGLWQLTKTMALQWAADGIRVNGVVPGLIMTDFAAALDKDPERKAAFLTRIPMQRFGTPADVANVVLFLASAESAWITGTSIVVDGGQLARN